MKLSIVIPALNEENSIGICVAKARSSIQRLGLQDSSEILVVDNGSTDRTAQIARAAGAAVVECPQKGYGKAYQAGLSRARGEFVITADADDSYNFEEIEPYLRKLEAGYDFVLGNRFQGRIEPGAMPWMHRFVGTPFLTAVMNLFFQTGVGDVNCGMRAMRKAAYERMHLIAPGMEFTAEIVIKASLVGLRIAEVPCNLYRDKRGRRPHLQTFRDGWRYLRFMLLFTPTWTFLFPGLTLAALGAAVMLALTARDAWFPLAWAAVSQRHMLSGLLLFLLGWQIIILGIAATVFGYSEYFDRESPTMRLVKKYFTLERGMAVGSLLAAFSGLVLLYLFVSFYWQVLPPLAGETVRLDIAIIAIACVLLGVQCVFASFLLSLDYLKVK